MKLATGLRVSKSVQIAFAGAGGKTSALFRLAGELAGKGEHNRGWEDGLHTVLTCATTHLAEYQIKLADYHYIVKDPRSLRSLDLPFPGGINLFSGEAVGENRVAGLDALTVQTLHELADQHKLPLLIEADGSRMKPLKAPAEHEPAIPPWVEHVVVVAGLSALGKPLSRDYVHRPERFGILSGLPIGSTITPEALLRVLLHPHGGLKNIPQMAVRTVLLNQADNDLMLASASWIADPLKSVYDSVLVSSLAIGDWQDRGVNVAPRNRHQNGVIAVFERIAGIVLAAGGSERLGQPKQLLRWKGETLVEKVARTAVDAGLSPVVVVTGAFADKVRAALIGLPVEISYNPDWEMGQASSVKAGLRGLNEKIGAAVFLLSDQPFVNKSIIRALVEQHSQTLAPIIAPLVDDLRGNPVLFDRTTFAGLASLEGDIGGRALFSRYPVDWIPWHDSNLLLDIDSQSDYDQLLAMDDL